MDLFIFDFIDISLGSAIIDLFPRALGPNSNLPLTISKILLEDNSSAILSDKSFSLLLKFK